MLYFQSNLKTEVPAGFPQHVASSVMFENDPCLFSLYKPDSGFREWIHCNQIINWRGLVLVQIRYIFLAPESDIIF